MKTATVQTPENVITLTVEPRPKKVSAPLRQRFKIKPFTNRTGTQSWRVAGIKRDGSRIRENYSEQKAAQCRQLELETEFLARESDTAIRATKLTDTQLRIAETAFNLLEDDSELLLATRYWLSDGKQRHRPDRPSVRLDEAVSQFTEWLARQPDNEMSRRTKKNLRLRVSLFANSLPNLELSAVSKDAIAKFMDGRNVSKRTKINDRLVLSRFFSWCKDSPRGWIDTNPARKEEKGKRTPRPSPTILSVDEVRKILSAAERFKRGRLAPYVSVCVFGGLRPSEAASLTWDKNVNLNDREIRLEAHQSKTRRPRTIKMGDTLFAWLAAYKGKPFFPSNWHKDFRKVKETAGFGTPTEDNKLKRWVEDVMRHTAISHYFRDSGSYGLTAEWAGNSEQIIKDHYQGRVSTEDTKKFYALLPTKRTAKITNH